MEKKSCWLKPVLVVVVLALLVATYVTAKIYFSRVENRAEVVLDKDMTLGVRHKEFNGLCDKIPMEENRNGGSLKIFSTKILDGFKKLILDKEDDLGLRERVAEVLLWRDPEEEMRTTIALLIEDRSQPLSLRNEALKVCTDQALLNAVILCDEEKQEFRNWTIWRSEDKEMLRRLLQSDNSDMRYRVAQRLCVIDKDWLRINVVHKQNADQSLRVALISFCFSGDEKVLDSVFSNKNESDTIRAMALENMVGYSGVSRHNIKTDRFLMSIMTDSDEGPLVRTTALHIYRKGGW